MPSKPSLKSIKTSSFHEQFDSSPSPDTPNKALPPLPLPSSLHGSQSLVARRKESYESLKEKPFYPTLPVTSEIPKRRTPSRAEAFTKLFKRESSLRSDVTRTTTSATGRSSITSHTRESSNVTTPETSFFHSPRNSLPRPVFDPFLEEVPKGLLLHPDSGEHSRESSKHSAYKASAPLTSSTPDLSIKPTVNFTIQDINLESSASEVESIILSDSDVGSPVPPSPGPKTKTSAPTTTTNTVNVNVSRNTSTSSRHRKEAYIPGFFGSEFPSLNFGRSKRINTSNFEPPLPPIQSKSNTISSASASKSRSENSSVFKNHNENSNSNHSLESLKQSLRDTLHRKSSKSSHSPSNSNSDELYQPSRGQREAFLNDESSNAPSSSSSSFGGIEFTSPKTSLRLSNSKSDVHVSKSSISLFGRNSTLTNPKPLKSSLKKMSKSSFGQLRSQANYDIPTTPKESISYGYTHALSTTSSPLDTKFGEAVIYPKFTPSSPTSETRQTNVEAKPSSINSNGSSLRENLRNLKNRISLGSKKSSISSLKDHDLNENDNGLGIYVPDNDDLSSLMSLTNQYQNPAILKEKSKDSNNKKVFIPLPNSTSIEISTTTPTTLRKIKTPSSHFKNLINNYDYNEKEDPFEKPLLFNKKHQKHCSKSKSLAIMSLLCLFPPLLILMSSGYLDKYIGTVCSKHKLISGLIGGAFCLVVVAGLIVGLVIAL